MSEPFYVAAARLRAACIDVMLATPLARFQGWREDREVSRAEAQRVVDEWVALREDAASRVDRSGEPGPNARRSPSSKTEEQS